MGNPFIYRGYVDLTTYPDFNDITTQGYYRVQNVTDMPNGPGINWCILLVFGNNSIQNNFVLQIASNGSTTKIRMRTNETTYTSWKVIG